MGFRNILAQYLTSQQGIVSIIIRGIVAIGSVVEESISIGIRSSSSISITPLATKNIGVMSIIVSGIVSRGSVVEESISIRSSFSHRSCISVSLSIRLSVSMNQSYNSQKNQKLHPDL